VSSVGPDKSRDLLCEDILWVEDFSTTGISSLKFMNINHVYDPTNGLLSTGDIVLYMASDPFYDPKICRVQEVFKKRAARP